jgi:hypothetical protein
LNHFSGRADLVRAEEDRGAEDSFESADKSPILLAAFVHSKDFEHLACAAETHDRALLLHCQCCQEDRNDAILTERNFEIRMAGDLQNELPVPTLVHQLIAGKPTHGQAAKYKRP